jgi:hypothetical protein
VEYEDHPLTEEPEERKVIPAKEGHARTQDEYVESDQCPEEEQNTGGSPDRPPQGVKDSRGCRLGAVVTNPPHESDNHGVVPFVSAVTERVGL